MRLFTLQHVSAAAFLTSTWSSSRNETTHSLRNSFKECPEKSKFPKVRRASVNVSTSLVSDKFFFFLEKKINFIDETNEKRKKEKMKKNEKNEKPLDHEK